MANPSVAVVLTAEEAQVLGEVLGEVAGSPEVDAVFGRLQEALLEAEGPVE